MYHTPLKTKDGYRHMNQIHNRVISSKIGEKEYERAKTAMNSLYKKGELSRNTTSCLVRKAVNELADEESEGKKERREEELKKMKEKMRTMENEIIEIEAENQRFKDEKISLERKLKNSEKENEILSYTNNAFQYANQKLMKENQDLKGHQLSPEMKGIIEMGKEMVALKYIMKP